MNAELRMQNTKRSLATLGMTIVVLVIGFLISIPAAQAFTPPCCVIVGACQGNYISQDACTTASNGTWDPGCTSAACNIPDTRPEFGPEPAPAAAPAGPTSPGVGLPNPLGTSDAHVIIGRIIKTFNGFAGGIGLLMFVYGGFIWLTSFGNPERIKKGQDLLLWATLGLVIMFSSYIVARYIITAVTRGTGTL